MENKMLTEHSGHKGSIHTPSKIKPWLLALTLLAVTLALSSPAVAQTCSNRFEGAIIQLQDNHPLTSPKRTLSFTTGDIRVRAETKVPLPDAARWKVIPAASSSGCAYFYLMEVGTSRYLHAGSSSSNRTVGMSRQSGADLEHNFQWKFIHLGYNGGNLYQLVERKHDRALLADEAKKGNVVGTQLHSRIDQTVSKEQSNDAHSKWSVNVIESPVKKTACSPYLSKINGSSNDHKFTEIHYAGMSGFNAKFKQALGTWKVTHTQSSMRLPDANGKAYFMFTASGQGAGWIWVVEVQGTSWSRTVTESHAKIVWFKELKNGCSSTTDCNLTSTMGNFNHPAKITMITGEEVVAIAFQNYKARYNGTNYLDRPNTRGRDSIAFFDVSRPYSPRFMFKQNEQHWDDKCKNLRTVSIGLYGGYYYMGVGNKDRCSYKFPKGELRRSGGPSNVTRVDSKKYNVFMNEGSTLFNVSLGTNGELSANIMSMGSTNPVGLSCPSAPVNRYAGNCDADCQEWRREAASDSRNFVRHGDDDKYYYIAHHRRPEQKKFYVIDLQP